MRPTESSGALGLQKAVGAHALEAPAQRGQGLLALAQVLGQRFQAADLLAGLGIEAAVSRRPSASSRKSVSQCSPNLRCSA